VNDQFTFALDIGTRSVVGIILQQQLDHYKVIDIVVKEHEERSMLDGQIHDILSVSKVIQEVKNELEKRHGSLKKVCVAAAGRALKTEMAKASTNITGRPLLTKEDILHLELSAVQQAQYQLASKYQSEKSNHYYCVGYSVISYKLDGEEIGNLMDQQGDEASVEIIATFLPKVVVESLLSALHRAGLEMEALTLEPIAAINVLIPPTMRRLNVALVDIGAGTSDIAITDLGTIIAYGMVPVAGDEITEAISDQFLLDFPIAEKVKREISEKETVTITDILGFETEISRNDIIAQITPAIEKLAEAICKEIQTLNNHKSPKAVMLVGGGSLTPDLPKKIAEKLNLPSNRVAIRGIDAIQKITLDGDWPKSPELVTPIGIAIASKQNPVHYVSVMVNGQLVRLFEMKQLTVGDCLLASGIQISKLYGKPGMAKIVTVNEQKITIPGQYGQPPVLTKNGNPCSFDDPIQEGDQIIVEKGKDGQSTEVRIKDLLDDIPSKKVIINGKEYFIHAMIERNQKLAGFEEFVEDRDMITCKFPQTIQELFEHLHITDLLSSIKPFSFTLNGEKISLPQYSGKVYKNHRLTSPNSPFEHGDVIFVEKGKNPTVKEIAETLGIKLTQNMPVIFQGQTITLSKRLTEFYRGNERLEDDDIIFSGETISMTEKKNEHFIFQDLFRHVDIEMPEKPTGRFILLKNGEEVTFHEQLSPGDQLDIYWPAEHKQ
jgi:cell division protein FtsA